MRENLLRLWRWLRQPVLGTTVIPKHARVDASLFSEDEFPVKCPRCDYSLRGLIREYCPECGTAYDRGRLLVTQYLGDGRSHPLMKNRWYRLCLFAGGLSIVLAGLAQALIFVSALLLARKIVSLRDFEQIADPLLATMPFALGALGAAGAASLVIVFRNHLVNVEQRKRILDALAS